MADVEKLTRVLQRLVSGGHSVLVIDLGPDGGNAGAIVKLGTHTGNALRGVPERI